MKRKSRNISIPSRVRDCDIPLDAFAVVRGWFWRCKLVAAARPLLTRPLFAAFEEVILFLHPISSVVFLFQDFFYYYLLHALGAAAVDVLFVWFRSGIKSVGICTSSIGSCCCGMGSHTLFVGLIL